MNDYYKINGVDILPYIAAQGLQIEENDVESSSAGRTLDGVMQRGIVARKDKHTIKCKPLTTAESNVVMQAVSAAEFVTVETNMHPKYGSVVKIMYNSSRTAAVLIRKGDITWWDNISFSLIER